MHSAHKYARILPKNGPTEKPEQWQMSKPEQTKAEQQRLNDRTQWKSIKRQLVLAWLFQVVVGATHSQLDYTHI